MKLCPGTTPQTGIWVPNPVTGEERLTHWDRWWGDKRQRGIKRIRMTCPRCGRRLMSSIQICDDGCHIIHTLPPHKPKGWWKHKKVNRKRKKGEVRVRINR